MNEWIQVQLPLVAVLCNPGLRRRHWQEMSALVGTDLVPNTGTTLRKFLRLSLMPSLEKYLPFHFNRLRKIKFEFNSIIGIFKFRFNQFILRILRDFEGIFVGFLRDLWGILRGFLFMRYSWMILGKFRFNYFNWTASFIWIFSNFDLIN